MGEQKQASTQHAHQQQAEHAWVWTEDELQVSWDDNACNLFLKECH